MLSLPHIKSDMVLHMVLKEQLMLLTFPSESTARSPDPEARRQKCT